jgi:hypothetical protein
LTAVLLLPKSVLLENGVYSSLEINGLIGVLEMVALPFALEPHLLRQFLEELVEVLHVHIPGDVCVFLVEGAFGLFDIVDALLLDAGRDVLLLA